MKLIILGASTRTSGYLDGPADQAKFNQPINIYMDDEGDKAKLKFYIKLCI
ncbi:MAG: hypothetical protein HQ565_03170 [Bacteroidetes bacterium]|nr:hypothetical protein [Bacteroidota bacterium]